MFTLKDKDLIAAYLMVLLAFIGVWSTIFINIIIDVESSISFVYTTIVLLFSSLLLPQIFTIILASVQYVLIILTLSFLPSMLLFDKVNLLAYLLIALILGIVSNNITDIQARRFHESSVKDHLTKLFNRRYFEETLHTLIERGASQKVTFGIILCDVDNFKSYNDRYGHAIGDHILQVVADFFSKKVGPYDIVCRYGGDEFAIIIPHVEKKRLFSIAKKIHTEIKGVDCSKNGINYPNISISMGVALFPIHGLTAEGLMMHADKELFKAKENGRDRISFSIDMRVDNDI